MRIITISLILFATLLTDLPQAKAETDDKIPIEIIELQYRSAAELLPHVEPLLGPRDTLTGTGHRLIVRASPGRLRQVRELVAELDNPVRELRLSVRISDDSRSDEHRLNAAGEYASQSRVIRRYTTSRGESVQWVRVQDGQQAHIRQGEVIPMAGTVIIHADGSLTGGIDYRQLESGFVVTPILAPDGRVRLHIAQIRDREAPGGRIESLALGTVMLVNPGEWVDLGGALGRAHDSDRRITGTRQTRIRDATNVAVMVELK